MMNNKTQKWLIGLVIALAVINVSLLVFVWRGHAKLREQMPSRRERIERPELTGRSIIRDLEMNKDQRDQFRSFFEMHRNRMDSMGMMLREAKNNVNRAIIENDSAALKTANEELFQIQRAAELETQQLTRSLTRIATDEQKRRFLQSMENVLIHQPNRRTGRKGQ
ncbi:hypothetical protein [Marinoscillum pacificum]|uniref:hypothetical protein n=1 Tax=Marinoscillum pacificum TaxID=392723 RepID=UPI00215758B2|nr:hypothetical protein [Marinoscillum pacificum]